MDGLGNLHFRLDLRQVGSLKCLDDIVVAGEDILLDEWSDQLCGSGDVVESFLLLFLQVFFKGIKLANVLLGLVLELQKLFLLFLVNTWNVDQQEALEPGTHLFLVTKSI